MTSKTHPPVPAEFQALARHCARFSHAVQSLVYADDRGTVLAAEATRFASLAGAAVEALTRPPAKDMPVGSLSDLARDIGPAIHLMGDLIEGFRRDAAAGVAVLPHQNDLQIGMELLDQSPEQVLDLARLICQRPWADPGPARTAFAECLADIGVPVAAMDHGGPGTIKILILIVLVLIIRTRPDLSATLIAVIVVLLRIDDAGNGKKKPPCPKKGDGGDGKTDCGDTFFVTAIGDDPNPVDSIGKARKNAMALAEFICPRRCPPRLIFIGRLRTVKQADGTFRTTGRYQFRCT